MNCEGHRPRNTDCARDAVVEQPCIGHFLGIVKISSIDDDWIFQNRTHAIEVQVSEFFPFRQHQQGITTLCGAVGVAAYNTPSFGMISLAFAVAAGSYTRTCAPSLRRASTIAIAGDSRTSSVPPLNASPRTASFFPRSVHNALRTL